MKEDVKKPAKPASEPAKGGTTNQKADAKKPKANVADAKNPKANVADVKKPKANVTEDKKPKAAGPEEVKVDDAVAPTEDQPNTGELLNHSFKIL